MTLQHSASRRDILKWGSLAGVSGGLLGSRVASGNVTASTSELPEVKAYYRLGRTEMEISDISFGASNLRPGQEDLVKFAIDRGINYLDTAESYTRGSSETVIGNAVKGLRDKVYIVSKTGADSSWSKERIMESLDASLKRLQTDYVDLYMNHAVNDVERMSSPEWQEFVTRAKEQGKIRFAGMSGHAGYLAQCLDYSIDNDLVDAILVAYNFGQDPELLAKLTRRFDFIALQPELPRLLKKAKEKDVGTVVMKTLNGARINDMRPYEKDGSTFAQAAFKWVLSNSDVDALIVTMRSEEQIDEFLGASGAERIASAEMQLLERYAMLNSEHQCRQGCGDCLSACPNGVAIDDVLRTRMYAVDYKELEFARDEYAMIASNASACLTCSGEPCGSACTYGLAINELSGPTHRMLA